MGEVRGIEVDPERGPPVDRVERLARRHEVVGDLRGVHLEAEAHALAVEHVEDRAPALREVLVAALDHGEVVRRERVEQVPHGGPGEPVHLLDAERGRGARRVRHPLGRALPDALGVAVAVDLRGEDAAVPVVDRVADGLADEVRAERPDAEAVLLQQAADGLRVAGIGDRPVDLEVVAPAGELEAVVAPARDLRRELRDRQIGPLAGEERDGTSQADLLGDRDGRSMLIDRLAATRPRGAQGGRGVRRYAFSRMTQGETEAVRMAKVRNQRRIISDEEMVQLVGLIKKVDSVELKASVPADDQRSAISSLELDPIEAQIRQVFFFDTPDLSLDSHGVVVRARRVQGRTGRHGCQAPAGRAGRSPGSASGRARRSASRSTRCPAGTSAPAR